MRLLHCSTRTLMVAVFGLLAVTTVARAQTDPLPSWNEGASKKAIVDFVQATTTSGTSKFVPPAERIATFDQDGTLWVEHPVYSQLMYILDRVPAVVKAKPQLVGKQIKCPGCGKAVLVEAGSLSEKGE